MKPLAKRQKLIRSTITGYGEIGQHPSVKSVVNVASVTQCVQQPGQRHQKARSMHSQQ